MANPFFRFKEFTVWHDRCAMKVGTDAVLLGAWANISDAKQVLDIGCGCGIISLMAAQRCKGEIVGVEIDKDAALQAVDNVKSSPWANRITIVNEDIVRYSVGQKYDVILSNPPYFVDALKCPDNKRTFARHMEGLDFNVLMSCVASLLLEDGECSIVIPTQTVTSVKAASVSAKLYLSRETDVCTKVGKLPKRTLLAFRLSPPVESVEKSQLIIEDALGRKTEEYQKMVTDFYL